MQRQVLRAHLAGGGRTLRASPTRTIRCRRSMAGGWSIPTGSTCGPGTRGPIRRFRRRAECGRTARNYATGHWLTGRLGALASDELARAIAADYGTAFAATDAAAPLLFGTELDGVVMARDALQPMLDATGLAVHDGADGLVLARPSPRLGGGASMAGTLADAGTALASRKRARSGRRRSAGWRSGYTDRERDYLGGTVTAMRLSGGGRQRGEHAAGARLAGARGAAERMLLAGMPARRETLEVALPPSQAALEPGDVLAIAGQGDGPFVGHGAARQRGAAGLVAGAGRRRRRRRSSPTGRCRSARRPGPRAIPLVAAAHLPNDPASPGRRGCCWRPWSTPWPGEVDDHRRCRADSQLARLRPQGKPRGRSRGAAREPGR